MANNSNPRDLGTGTRKTPAEGRAHIVPFKPPEEPPGGTVEARKRQKPVIRHGWAIPDRTDAFLEIVAERRSLDFVLFDGKPHRVVRRQQGGLGLEPHTVFSVRGYFVRLVDYLDEKDDDKTPPDYLMQDILQVGEYPGGILRVSGLVFAPTVHEDGHIVMQPGYDEHSGLVLDLSGMNGEINVPEIPTQEDIAKSLGVIDDLLHDFPAADRSSRAHYIALLLTPLVREMIGGSIPAYLVRARTPRTGKTLFVDVAGIIAGGTPPPVLHLEANNDMLERLILSRPAVEAGERLGFLPGDMKEKVDPYLRPLYDALYDMLPAEQVERRIASGEIEIAPIAFMRGRTLADAFIILDEAQNTTPQQMKMVLTRFGMRSRMVVCGDPLQVDLPNPGMSGLADAVEKLEGIPKIATVRFGAGDVVRHPLVGRIVEAYEGPIT